MNRIPAFVTELWIDRPEVRLDEIRSEVEQIHGSDSGLERSNVGGYHSNPFLPVVSQPELGRLASEATKIVRSVGTELEIGDLRLNGMWVNISWPGHRNEWHYHPFTVLSAVFYVDVPEGSGALRLERPDLLHHYWRRSSADDPRSRQVFRFEPSERDLVVFPACLRHDVEPNESKVPRVSIAMNFAY